MNYIWTTEYHTLVKEPGKSKRNKGRVGGQIDIPESLLHAAYVVIVPVLLGDILLSDWDTRPLDTHLSHAINVVLVEVDLLGAEMVGRPLCETPLLHDLLGLVESDELASHVAVEDGKFTTHLGTVELTRRATGESSNALWVCESSIKLLGGCAHLIRRRHGCGVNMGLAGGRGRGCSSWSGLIFASLGMNRGRGKAAGWVDARGVLKILGMFGDEVIGQLGQRSAKLRGDLGSDKVLHRLLGGRVAVILDLKLTKPKHGLDQTNHF